jgi:hypothetical protein
MPLDGKQPVLTALAQLGINRTDPVREDEKPIFT